MMMSPQWTGFDAFFDYFMKVHFLEQSIKKNTEFDTIWYAAEQEGARRLLLEFKQQIEEEAKKVITNNL